MTGWVLRVERLSVHDGPGLRSTVFLKGCPLRCRWCHNPESASPRPELGFLARQCVGCHECEAVCQHGVHTFDEDGHHLDRERCVICGQCVDACLHDALVVYGQELTVGQVCDAVLEDRTFYEQSGGGCTLSGGEPLLQSEFCAAVLSELGRQGLHRAVDTSGAVPWRCFEDVLPHTDLFLFDIKHPDDGPHREQVGSSNVRILDNFAKLSEVGIPIEVRIPLIPGFNDDPETLAAVGQRLADHDHLIGVRLLPYHLARQKYQDVGRPDTMPEVTPPPPSQIAQAAEILARYGLTVLT